MAEATKTKPSTKSAKLATETKDAPKRGLVDHVTMRKILGPTSLFIIERNLDEDIVVYEAVLSSNGQELVGVNMFWTKQNNWAERVPVSESAKNMFYGVKTHKLKKGLYRMQLNCLVGEEKPVFVDLHIKKSGRVVPTIVINEKECVLEKIYTTLTTMPPSISSLWIIGTFKDRVLETQLHISQNIIDRIDISDFIGIGV